MRARLVWLLGLGVAALVAARALLGRRRPAPVVADATGTRAEELRRRLDESRGLAGERDEFEEHELPVDRVDAAPDPDERRRAVHEDGRAAVDEMRGASG